MIVKWFLDEDKSKEALGLRKEHIDEKVVIIVPDLLFIEVINALRYKNIEERVLMKVNESLWGMQLHVEKLNPFLLKQAIKVALQYNFSLYDSLYVALAQIHGCEIVTSDKKLGKFPQTVLL